MGSVALSVERVSIPARFLWALGTRRRASAARQGAGVLRQVPATPPGDSRHQALRCEDPVPAVPRVRSKRSRFMTLFHAATKSATNLGCASLQA